MTPAARVARRLRITEGQVYTVGTSLALALVLLGLGLPSLSDVVTPSTDDQVRTTPLALPGSPAVADVIVVAAPDRGPGVPAGSDLASDLGGMASTPAFTTPPRINSQPLSTTEASNDEAPAVLRVTEARYATASGPLVPSGPPGSFLPVGLRLGTPDKQSYLRLSGAGTTLVLKLSSEPAHQFGEVNAVRACRIIPAEWMIVDGSSLAAAPQVDPVDCTFGRSGPTGWTFELRGVNTRNGVALVPSGPSTGAFQLTFNQQLAMSVEDRERVDA